MRAGPVKGRVVGGAEDNLLLVMFQDMLVSGRRRNAANDTYLGGLGGERRILRVEGCFAHTDGQSSGEGIRVGED
jgi:hypothetical protein